MINSIYVFRPNGAVYAIQESDGPVRVTHGDVIRVISTFEYRQPSGFTCSVIAYIGTRASKVLSSTVTQTLPPANDFTPASSVNDIEIKKGTKPGIYNLGVDIPQGGAEAFYEIPQCIEVYEEPGMMSMLGMMLPLMMLMMMVGMMSNMMED